MVVSADMLKIITAFILNEFKMLSLSFIISKQFMHSSRRAAGLSLALILSRNAVVPKIKSFEFISVR